MTDKLVKLFRQYGIKIDGKGSVLEHLFEGASHRQIVQYAFVNNQPKFFLSGDEVIPEDYGWLYSELVRTYHD